MAKLPLKIYRSIVNNRLQCTTIHLKVVGQLLDLHNICDDAHPDYLGVSERKLVEQHCLVALSLADQYMTLHAEDIEDRGCEGTLISYYHTISAYVKHIQKVFLGGNMKEVQPSSTSKPPAPGESSK